jgi:hypothetical protein
MPRTPFFVIAVMLAAGGLALAAAPIERQVQRTFQVEPDSTVRVDMSGAPIAVTTVPGRSVDVRLREIINADSDRQADDLLADYDVSLDQQGREIALIVRRKRDARDSWRGESRVRFEATIAAPPDVRLDLDTSGGSISVRGERTAHLDANTSGGSITVEGGRGSMSLDTSGGRIQVERALTTLRADTSGGGITVGYVGASATEVMLSTSGGSIRVGVDPDAKLDLSASTSGGGVHVEGLRFETRSLTRSRASGTLNGGGGRLRAETSGGSIDIRSTR